MYLVILANMSSDGHLKEKGLCICFRYELDVLGYILP